MPDISIDRVTHIRISDVMNADNSGMIAVDSIPSYTEYTEGIESGSLFFNQSVVQDKVVYGKAIASRFECRLHIDEDVKGKEITVWQADSNGNNIKYIFNGIIDSAQLNRGDYYREIIAYDKFYTLANLDVTDWWEGVFDSSHPARSFKWLWQNLCNYAGIQCDTTFSPSISTLTIAPVKASKFTKISFTTILQYLTACTCAIPYIRPDGSATYYTEAPAQAVNFNGLSKIEFCTFVNSSYIDVTNNYETGNSEFADVIAHAPDGVKFLNEDGSILRRYPNTPISATSPEYTFAYNPLLAGLVLTTSWTEILTYCWQHQPNSNFWPGKINLIVSNLDISVGNEVGVIIEPATFEHPYTVSRNIYVLETTLSGPLLIEQELVCNQDSEPFISNDIDTGVDSKVGVEDTTDTDISTLQTSVSALTATVQEMLPTEWFDIELTSGITAEARGGSTVPKYRRVGDRVDIVGAVTLTTAGSTAIKLGQLPEGYRPANTHYYNTSTADVASDGFIARMTVQANNGNINLSYVRNLTTGAVESGQSRWVEINTSFFII